MNAIIADDLVTRPPEVVMDLRRLGSLYPYPLSFMRCLIRQMKREHWDITRTHFTLDANGLGEARYQIDTGGNIYTFAVFSHYLDPDLRSDRVIAEQWDMTAALCAGKMTDARFARLRENVPKQEAGRLDADCLVLTRANKSSRIFDAVIENLARGRQPDLNLLAKIGYLFRTTAVYGSGKFGMADWEKLQLRFPELASPFMAEMLVCFLIREFSLDLTDWVAAQRSAVAVKLSAPIKRYIGIGNATGLGMAPFLISHPQLISQWIEVRETALARSLAEQVTPRSLEKFVSIAQKAVRHLSEISTDNPAQNALNLSVHNETVKIIDWAREAALNEWSDITRYAAAHYDVNTQELVNSALMEVHKEKLYDLQPCLSSGEDCELIPDMSLSALKTLIETHYDWALNVDYGANGELETFWYRSAEKMEPRLGKRSVDRGGDREMLLGIGYAAKTCYGKIGDELAANGDGTVARFIFDYPEHRYIARRIQSMAGRAYGEVQSNLLSADVLPIDLLRCKLSFFGVGKFDPRSNLWVRNTMFQGAPIASEIGKPFSDDWCFPVQPNV